MSFMICTPQQISSGW